MDVLIVNVRLIVDSVGSGHGTISVKVSSMVQVVRCQSS